jgi:hypothetical protein
MAEYYRNKFKEPKKNKISVDIVSNKFIKSTIKIKEYYRNKEFLKILNYNY